MKKIAAPGRRGSTKPAKFVADGDVVDEIAAVAISPQSAKSNEQQVHEACAVDVAREEAKVEERKAAEERRQAELRQREQQEIEAAEQQAREEAEEEELRQKQLQQEARTREILQHRQQLQKQREEEEAAAAAEAAKQREAEAAALLTQQQREEELKRQQQEAEEALRQQEAAKIAAAEEKRRLLLQMEAEQLEYEREQERLLEQQREQERLLRQRKDQEEAAEAARRQEEAAEAARRQEEAAEAARRQEEAAELARRQEEAAEAARRQEEAAEAARRQEAAAEIERQRIEQQEHEAEQQRLHKEHLAEAERIRQARLAAEAAEQRILRDQLLQQEKAAKEQQDQRSKFLFDVDDFSSKFLAQQASSAPVASIDDIATAARLQRSAVAMPELQQVVKDDTPIVPAEAPSSASAEPAIPAPQPAALPKPVIEEDIVIPSILSSLAQEEMKSEPVEELRAPTRFAAAEKKKKAVTEKKKVAPEMKNETPVSAPIATSAPKATTVYYDSDEDSDSGMTVPSHKQAAWRAKRDDLNSRRREFHGAVTYAFKGVFSWQMYGTVDTTDEYGKPYTEYLMRCQWGSTWDNMSPWVVARRFREFDILDQLLRKAYPDEVKHMSPLPEKKLFSSLNREVVGSREKGIEDYMSRIVTKIPTMLKSGFMNDFLGISQRIESIKATLPAAEPVEEHPDATTDYVQLAPGGESEMAPEHEDVIVQEEIVRPLQLEDLMTEDDAETKYHSLLQNAQTTLLPFDGDDLGQAEEHIRDLRRMVVRSKTNRVLKDHAIIRQLRTCQKAWPYIRGICINGLSDTPSKLSTSLLPRALQAEEELDQVIKELRSLLIAQSMGSPLHF